MIILRTFILNSVFWSAILAPIIIFDINFYCVGVLCAVLWESFVVIYMVLLIENRRKAWMVNRSIIVQAISLGLLRQDWRHWTREEFLQRYRLACFWHKFVTTLLQDENAEVVD